MKAQLQEQEHYAQLKQVLSHFLQSRRTADKQSSQASKETLKVVLAGLVEEVWHAAQTPQRSLYSVKVHKAASQVNLNSDFEREGLRSSRTNDTLTRQLASSKDYRPSSARIKSPQLVERSIDQVSKSLLARSTHEALSFSEFCAIKSAGSFSKATRKLNEPIVSSPGPSSYKFDLLNFRSKSPRVVIPVAKVKASHEKPFTTPGPAAYYPINSSRSKR
jgi:hypothetical protein